MPEKTKSRGCPESSIVTMTPYREPVSTRALSTTSCRTVSTSRVSLTRTLASLSLERRSRCASSSRLSSSCVSIPRRFGRRPCRFYRLPGRFIKFSRNRLRVHRFETNPGFSPSASQTRFRKRCPIANLGRLPMRAARWALVAVLGLSPASGEHPVPPQLEDLAHNFLVCRKARTRAMLATVARIAQRLRVRIVAIDASAFREPRNRSSSLDITPEPTTPRTGAHGHRPGPGQH